MYTFFHVQTPVRPYHTRGSQKTNRTLFLSKADSDDITVEGHWLESNHVNAPMNLIKRQFPSIGRLYDSTLGWDLDFPPAHGDKWIQIIHDGKGHWVVATKSKEIDCVLIYDSLGGSSSEIEEHVIGCIISLPKKFFLPNCWMPEATNYQMKAAYMPSPTHFHWH